MFALAKLTEIWLKLHKLHDGTDDFKKSIESTFWGTKDLDIVYRGWIGVNKNLNTIQTFLLDFA